jgi:tRNA threonylcarbamoyl adenosine modification protein YeaZ
MNVLIIETTLPSVTIGLVDTTAGKTFSLRDNEPRPSHRLQGHLETVLKEAGLTQPDLDHIVVTRGPGSFTGARVGLAIAQALHQALGVPVTPLTTLQALALSAQTQTPITVLIDSQSSEIFMQNFNADGAPVDDPRVLLPADVHIPPGVQVVGNGVEKCGIPGNATLQVDPAAMATRATPQQKTLPLHPLYLKPLTYRKVSA